MTKLIKEGRWHSLCWIMFTYDRRVSDVSRLACSVKALVLVNGKVQSIFFEDYAYDVNDIIYLKDVIRASTLFDGPDVPDKLTSEIDNWLDKNKGKHISDVLSKMFQSFDCQ